MSVAKPYPQSANYAYHLMDHHEARSEDNAANNVTKVRQHFNVQYQSGENVHAGIETMQIGELSCDADYKVMDHLQWCHEISLIISGTAIFQVDQTFHTLSPGDICISPQGSLHAIEATSPLRYAYIGFNIHHTSARSLAEADILVQINRAFVSMPQPILKDTHGIAGLVKLLLDEYYTFRPFTEEIRHHLLLTILFKLLRTTPEYDQNTSTREAETQRTGVVYHVIRYIERNHLVTHTIEQIADELGYSKFHLSHLFKAQTGQTLQQFMLDTRMKHAEELLMESEDSITQISERLGYSTTQAFSRSFKKHCGMSPTEFITEIKKISRKEQTPI